jgi:hypothetical protein
VNLDPDTAATVEALRRDKGLGLSEAVNELIRSGAVAKGAERPRYVLKTFDMGLKIDVTNIGEVLEYLDTVEGRTCSW